MKNSAGLFFRLRFAPGPIIQFGDGPIVRGRRLVKGLCSRLRITLLGSYEMQSSSLEAIHNELRSLNDRLAFIEDLIEEVILRQLPKAKISAKEIAQIKKSVAEMKAGERVTLEELASA